MMISLVNTFPNKMKITATLVALFVWQPRSAFAQLDTLGESDKILAADGRFAVSTFNVDFAQSGTVGLVVEVDPVDFRYVVSCRFGTRPPVGERRNLRIQDNTPQNHRQMQGDDNPNLILETVGRGGPFFRGLQEDFSFSSQDPGGPFGMQCIVGKDSIGGIDADVKIRFVDCSCFNAPAGQDFVEEACVTDSIDTAKNAVCGSPPAPGGGGGGGGDSSDGGGGGGGGCFSKDTTVQIGHKGNSVPMKMLEVGDKVLTADGTFKTVYTFGHRHESAMHKFYRIATSNADGAVLEMTGEHLVYVKGKSGPVRVDSIAVGQILQSPENGVTSENMVTKIDKVVRKGLYAPLTTDGTIVVAGGVMASSYVGLQTDANENVHVTLWNKKVELPFLKQATVIHHWLSPLRIVCLSFDSSYCEAHNEEGIQYFVAFGMNFVKVLEKQTFVIQLVMVILPVFLAGISFVFEAMYGPEHAMAAAMVIAASIFYYRRSTQSRTDALRK